MTARIEKRLAELGLALPPANAPFASFQPVVIVNGLAFVAGQPPVNGAERSTASCAASSSACS